MFDAKISTNNEPEDDRALAKSLNKALAILEAIGTSDTPLRVAEVALKTGISRPTCYRIIQTLASGGYVYQDRLSGRLAAGFSLLMLTANLLDSNRMRLESLPHLQSLANLTGERTNLGILHRNQVLYLAGVEKPSLPTIYSRFGKTAPAHCCSLGKAILSYIPENEVLALLAAKPLKPVTPNSITSMSRFLDELKTTRERGFAIDRAEHVANSFCIAAPIMSNDRAVGAISVSSRTEEPLLTYVPVLLHTAETISHVL